MACSRLWKYISHGASSVPTGLADFLSCADNPQSPVLQLQEVMQLVEPLLRCEWSFLSAELVGMVTVYTTMSHEDMATLEKHALHVA